MTGVKEKILKLTLDKNHFITERIVKMIKVKFLGKEYNLSEQLPVFIPLIKKFDVYKEFLVKKLIKQIEKNEFSGGGDDFVYWSQPISDIAKKVIRDIAEYGIYDLTEYDLVECNPGYKKIHAVCSKTMNKMLDSLTASMKEWEEEYDAAYADAASNITGSGVSVWTSSLGNALLYSVMEMNTLKKQAKKADKQFDEALRELNTRNKSNRKREEMQIKKSIYYPGCKDALDILIGYMFDLCLKKLDENSVISSSELKSYDLKISNEIMNNLEVITQKAEVLGKAFEKCPYNLRVFAMALEMAILDDDSLDVILKLKLNDEFEELLNEKIGVLTIDNLKKEINNCQYYIHLGAVFDKKTDIVYKREKTKHIREQVIREYDYLKRVITNQNSCREFCYKISQNEDIFRNIKEYINDIISMENFECLMIECGHADILTEICPTDFNEAIDKKNIDEVYISKLAEKCAPVYFEIIKQREKDKEENRKLEEQLKQERQQEIEVGMRKKKKKKIIIVTSILVPILMFMGFQTPNIVHNIRESNQYKEIITEYGEPFGGIKINMDDDKLDSILGKPDEKYVEGIDIRIKYNNYKLLGVDGTLEIHSVIMNTDNIVNKINHGTIDFIQWISKEKEKTSQSEILDRWIMYYIEHNFEYKKMEESSYAGDNSKLWKTDDLWGQLFYRNGMLTQILIESD